jgi:site-specific DNA recombinase
MALSRHLATSRYGCTQPWAENNVHNGPVMYGSSQRYPGGMSISATHASKIAVAYIRVSTADQLLGVSLAVQEDRIRAYCQMAELHLVDTIREDGVSAYAIPLSKRPAGIRLLRVIKHSHAEHVVVLKLDRLFRNAADALLQTRKWDTEGIALHLVDIGGQTINTATAVGRMFLTQMAGFAEFEESVRTQPWLR